MLEFLTDKYSYDKLLASFYAALLEPFGDPAFGPELATGLLLLALVVLFCFFCFALPQDFRLRAALKTIRTRSEKSSGQEKLTIFRREYQRIDAALLSNKATSLVWQGFRNTLRLREIGENAIFLASTRPQNFFNPRNLRVQYDFVRSLPNFFVGLGLLGTFVGLIAALTSSAQSLASAADQDAIKAALKLLLTTAAAKFYISAAGLVASLVLSLSIKLALKRLHGLVHQINDALEERLLFESEQTITENQLLVQQRSLEELKLFNTNIAMKIGDAVRNAVQASNDSLTSKLSAIADSFDKLVGASGEGAGRAVGEAMKGAFDTSLRQASKAIEDIAAELKELPTRLATAATSIQTAGATATQQQKDLAETLQASVKAFMSETGTQVAERIKQGTQDVVADLKGAGSTFGDSAVKIEKFVDRFDTSGDNYLKSLSSLAEENAKLEKGLASLSSQIVAATNGVTRASSAMGSNLDKMLAGATEFVRVASETSRTAKESQESIRATVEALQQQMSAHLQRFNSVDEKLASVFNSIGAQLELQSRQMSERLTTMDSALASAVNQFEILIDELANTSSRPKAAE